MTNRIYMLVIALIWLCPILPAKIHSISTSLASTSKAAQLIIVGEVTDVIPLSENRLALIKVLRVVKGETQSIVVKAFFYGPMPGGNKTSVDSEFRVLRFAKGEKVLIFLRAARQGDHFEVVNLEYGKLEIFQEEKSEAVKIPDFYQYNDKLNKTESLEKILRLIESFQK